MKGIRCKPVFGRVITGQGKVVGKGVWIHVSGTWDTSNWLVQFKGKDGTFRTLDGSALTANGDKFFDLPHGTLLRGVIASVGGSTSLYWQFSSAERV